MNITSPQIITLLTSILLLPSGCLSLGCQAPTAMPREMVSAMSTAMIKIADEGVLTDFATDFSGQAIEPGVEFYAGIIYVAGGKLTGVSVQADVGAGGVGSGKGLSDAARAKILAMFPDDPQTGTRILDIIEAKIAGGGPPDDPG